MEVLSLLGAGLSVGVAAFVLAPSSKGVGGMPLGERGIPGRVRLVCGRVSRLAPVRAFGRTPHCALVVSEVVRALRLHGCVYDEFEALGLLSLGIAFISLLGAFVAFSPMGAIVGACMSFAGVLLRASAIERRRRRELVEEMPGVFRSLAVSLGSGKTLSQAIEYVGTHGRGPVGERFARAALSVRCGASVSEALEELGRDLDAPGVELLATALLISQRTGSPLHGLFVSSAKMVEDKTALERMLVTKTAQARLSARIVCALPLLMVGTLSMLSPEFRAGVASAQGTICLGVAILLDVIAILVMRRLMRGVMA